MHRKVNVLKLSRLRLLFYYVLHEKPRVPDIVKRLVLCFYCGLDRVRALQRAVSWTEGWDPDIELLLRDVFIHGTGLFIKILLHCRPVMFGYEPS